MGGNPLDFAFSQVLEQVIRKHHDTIARRICIGHLTLACGQNKNLTDADAGLRCQRENPIPQLTSRESMRIRLAHTHFQAAEDEKAEQCHDKENARDTSALRKVCSRCQEEHQWKGLRADIDRLLQ